MTRHPKKSQQKLRARTCTYGARVIGILSAIWEAAGYPWSVRLKKALPPLWMPWAKKTLSNELKIDRSVG